MAISASCVWEVRGSATGGALNGGGFVPGGGGVDYSQQDTAQYSMTDLAATGGNTAAPNVTSASHTFVADDVGNIIHITAGTNWTAGWYEIKSISGGGAVLDRACATVASPTAGTAYVGGALSMNATTINTWAGTLSGGNKIWIKGGATITVSVSVSIASPATSVPIVIEGYSSVRGDTPTGDDRPLLDMGLNNTLTTGSPNRFWNARITGGNSTLLSVGNGAILKNCKVTHTAPNANRVAVAMTASGAVMLDCNVSCYRGTAVTMAAQTAMIGCFIHDSVTGVLISASGLILITGCIFACHTTRVLGLSGVASQLTMLGNTFYGSQSKMGIGIDSTATNPAYRVYNNIFYGFAEAFKISSNASYAVAADFNCYFNNTTDLNGATEGVSTIYVDPDFTNVSELSGTATTAGSVLTDASADFSAVLDGYDYCYVISGTGATLGQYLITSHTTTTLTLDSTIGTSAAATYQVITGRDFSVGENVKALGSPDTIGLTPNHIDIGAAQRAEPVVSGGGGGSGGISKGRIVNAGA